MANLLQITSIIIAWSVILENILVELHLRNKIFSHIMEFLNVALHVSFS